MLRFFSSIGEHLGLVRVFGRNLEDSFSASFLPSVFLCPSLRSPLTLSRSFVSECLDHSSGQIVFLVCTLLGAWLQRFGILSSHPLFRKRIFIPFNPKILQRMLGSVVNASSRLTHQMNILEWNGVCSFIQDVMIDVLRGGETIASAPMRNHCVGTVLRQAQPTVTLSRHGLWLDSPQAHAWNTLMFSDQSKMIRAFQTLPRCEL